MTWLRKLLLFGGVPAAGASASVPIVLNYQKNRNTVEGFDENEKVGEIDISGIKVNTEDKDEQIKILKRAGLFCGTTIEDGKECKVYSVGLRLKDGNNNVEEGLKISSSSKGKLVLRKKNNNTYSYGLRLTVEEGDIFLEGSGKTHKLERFESFGLEEQGKELHLVRKETQQQGVMRALGIPSNCELPADGNTRTCTLSHEQIKNVHFDGKKEEGATVSGTQNITLNISKSVDSNLFKESYRFAFSSPAEITIKEGDVIRTNASTEFTVKEWNEEDMVLVRAGSGEKEEEFFSKVGLKCDSSNICTIQGGKLNVIKGDSTDDNKLTAGSRTGTGNGIIKLYREQANYVNGLKFSIEGEDITISGTPQNSHINRLSLLDGYEIVESKGHFYLKRKDSGLASIVKRLGLFENPSSNVENTTDPVFSTNVPANQANKIKFYVGDKGVSPVGNNSPIEVKGYRTTDTDTYKYGYRFTLKPTGGDVTIGTIKLKKDVTFDYKIREKDGELYLERTISPEKLIELVGLSCTKDGDNQTETCTFLPEKVNVRHWNGNLKGTSAVTAGTGIGKLKLTRDQADYTDGFMFTVEGGDISFNGGTQDREKIKMSEFEKYGISMENGTWFLSQKTNFMQEKYSAMGIDEKCKNQFHGECEMEGMYVANNVKFKAKKDKTTKGQFSNDAKVKFQMAKNVMYPFGIKVDMWVDGGSDKHVSVVCSENETPTLLKLTNTKTEFKIEKIGNDFYLAKTTGESNETCTVSNTAK